MLNCVSKSSKRRFASKNTDFTFWPHMHLIKTGWYSVRRRKYTFVEEKLRYASLDSFDDIFCDFLFKSLILFCSSKLKKSMKSNQFQFLWVSELFVFNQSTSLSIIFPKKSRPFSSLEVSTSSAPFFSCVLIYLFDNHDQNKNTHEKKWKAHLICSSIKSYLRRSGLDRIFKNHLSEVIWEMGRSSEICRSMRSRGKSLVSKRDGY